MTSKEERPVKSNNQQDLQPLTFSAQADVLCSFLNCWIDITVIFSATNSFFPFLSNSFGIHFTLILTIICSNHGKLCRFTPLQTDIYQGKPIVHRKSCISMSSGFVYLGNLKQTHKLTDRLSQGPKPMVLTGVDNDSSLNLKVSLLFF